METQTTAQISSSDNHIMRYEASGVVISDEY